MAGGIPNYLYRVPFFVLRVCFVFASFIRVFGGGGFPARLCILPIFSGICFCVLVLVCLRCFLIFVVFALFFIFLFFLCSRWSFVDVPPILSCPADHVPDWQPRILLGVV